MVQIKSFKILQEQYWNNEIYKYISKSFTNTFIHLPSKDAYELIALTKDCFSEHQSFNWHIPLFIYTDSITPEHAINRPQQKVLDKMRRGFTNFNTTQNGRHMVHPSGFGFYFYLDDLDPNVSIYFQKKTTGTGSDRSFILVFEINNQFGGAVYINWVKNYTDKPLTYIAWGLSPDIFRAQKTETKPAQEDYDSQTILPSDVITDVDCNEMIPQDQVEYNKSSVYQRIVAFILKSVQRNKK